MQKIIHIDMDCFYAAIEMRDNPSLANKPIAVGGSSHNRGVLCTCNYQAREYGVHSAMATATAMRLCPDLVLLPVNMDKYRQVSQAIKAIFHSYTKLVEPLSLDEAYLDVTGVPMHQGSATLIAKAIRQDIWDSQQLTSSAGIAPNKFLAKIASDWNKPNGQFVIPPHEVSDFVLDLPVEKLFGVGKVTAKKLDAMGMQTCADLQKLSLTELVQCFGKFGQTLYQQSRGIDERQVRPHRERKSLSVEHTFPQDLENTAACIAMIKQLYQELLLRIEKAAKGIPIKNQFIKIKYSDFKQATAQLSTSSVSLDNYQHLFIKSYQAPKAVRLLGMGVQFEHNPESLSYTQLSLI